MTILKRLHFLLSNLCASAPLREIIRFLLLRILHCYSCEFAQLTQIGRESKNLGFGYCSRQGAKTLSDRPKACHPERMRGI